MKRWQHKMIHLKCLKFFKKVAQSSAGFSLMEILIGIALMAIIGGVVVTKVLEQFHEGKVNAAIIQMQAFDSALKDFKRKCNFYPSTEQGLDSLVNKPSLGRECKRYPPSGFLETIPLDPWDGEYDYVSDGKKFRLASFGSDNDSGGEGEDADIYHGKGNRPIEDTEEG